ncbi:MAG: CHASE2 domain-containing protein [Rhodoferax sp.]|nr:CHASE2 domain-containing protein [Rhodoferax sp.]
MIDQIAAAGARQQIFDIVFTDPQPQSQAFIRAVQQHQPVLSQIFALEQGGKPSVGALAGALDWTTCPQPFAQGNGYLANFAALKPAHIGHITPRVGSDGLVRHQPAVICYQDKSYPALGIAAFMRGTSERSLTLERGTHWFDPAWALHAPNFALGPIPLDDQGDLRVSWRMHPDSFISISASDVLAGRVPGELMKNAWVLVGATAFGLNDSIATPTAAPAPAYKPMPKSSPH